MDKLTLEHIAPYLPHNMQFISEMDVPYDHHEKNPIWTLNGVNEMFGDYCLLTKENNDAYAIHFCKLLLRPLSDLTKEITHNGETFVPIEILGWNSYVHIIKRGTCGNVSYQYILKLLEWHFDVFGLIGRALALDINTLKEGK